MWAAKCQVPAMTQSLMARDRAEAKRKGFSALAAWAGSGLLLFYHAPTLGLLAAGGGAYLTYRWFMFRAKRGMRFH
jgi:hypothetical protein